MKRRISTIYAIFCTLLLVAGFLLTFYFAWQRETSDVVKCLVGFFLGFVFSPILHELGHVCFAKAAKMDCVYVKCFCFKVYIKDGRKRFGFASPFSADQTQVLPKTGGDMQKRAAAYTLGGLIFSGIFILVTVACAVLTTVFVSSNYLLWGILPYMGYLFLLNVAPMEYASGKTDASVYIGLKRNYDAEKTMLSTMEIQGRLFEGKSFAEIDETLYFDLPQLCEDEPLFAVILDLRYRYYLEKEDFDAAGKCLNRLVSVMEYLPYEEAEKVAAELVYMNSLRGELEDAETNAQACRGFLKQETATAKRILAAWSKANGNAQHVEALLAQGAECLKKERIAGVKKFEQILLASIEK